MIVTESDVKKMVTESVKKILKEWYGDPTQTYSDTYSSQKLMEGDVMELFYGFCEKNNLQVDDQSLDILSNILGNKPYHIGFCSSDE